MYCNKCTDDVTACKEQKRTTRDEVELCDCCSLHAVTSSVIYYRRADKFNLFVLYNKSQIIRSLRFLNRQVGRVFEEREITS